MTGTEIVGPDALWIIDPSDTPTATLFACHPPGSTRQRIVVHLRARLTRRSFAPTVTVWPPCPTLRRRPRDARHDDASTTDAARARLARPALALGAGALVALAMPPWGFWPLAVVGVMLFEIALGARTVAASTIPARLPVRRRLDVPRDGLDDPADPARLPRRRVGLRAVPRCSPR